MNICVYGASSNTIDSSYIEQTEYLGRQMAKRGHSLVYGAGANGLMGAVARGAHEEHGKIIGVAPSFFNVDGILYENITELITTETMREKTDHGRPGRCFYHDSGVSVLLMSSSRYSL